MWQGVILGNITPPPQHFDKTQDLSKLHQVAERKKLNSKLAKLLNLCLAVLKLVQWIQKNKDRK